MRFFLIILLLITSQVRAHDKTEYRVMFFSMTGCYACEQMMPTIRSLQERGYPIHVHKDDFELASKYGVTAYPTTIIAYKGKVVHRYTGVYSEQQALHYLDKYFPKSPVPCFKGL